MFVWFVLAWEFPFPKPIPKPGASFVAQWQFEAVLSCNTNYKKDE